jgi:hypothetical protein
MASRMATSRLRPAERGSNRLATLAQAIGSTSPTAPSSTNMAVRTRRTMSAPSGYAQHDPAVRLRIGFCQPRADGLHLALGLRQRHAGLEPGDGVIVMLAAVVQNIWRPTIRHHEEHWLALRNLVGRLEAGGQHADHFVSLAIQRDGAANDCTVAAQSLSP